MSIGYKPTLQENIENKKIKINHENNTIKSLKKTIIEQYETNSASTLIKKMKYLTDTPINKTNVNIDIIEEKLFGDVLDCKVQSQRIESVMKELHSISDTLSLMIYGEIISIDEADEKDKEAIEKIKNKNKANNINLCYLAKILKVVNEYILVLEKHIETIYLLNSSIYYLTDNDRKLLLDEEEINAIQSESKTNLEDQLTSSNFISDNLIFKNYLTDVYNLLIQRNDIKNALKKLYKIPEELETKIYDNDVKLKRAIQDFICTCEYNKIQCDSFNNLLFSRVELIKSFYKTN